MQAPQYNQPPPQYYAPPQQYQQYSPDAEKAATSSMVCGIISLFIPVILSIIAIVQANKAKRLGYVGSNATIGKVLGIVTLILGLLGIVGSIAMFAGLFALGL